MVRRRTGILWLGLLLATSGLPLTASGQDLADSLRPYLQGIGLDAKQFAAAVRGTTVVKKLITQGDRDVAVFGITRIVASQDAVLDNFLDFKASLGAVKGRRFGVFGDPPQPDDVAEVSLEEDEYRELRDCRPGDCGFKLPAVTMQAFAQGIEWSAPDAKVQADHLVRAALIRLVRRYRDQGDRALLSYDDRNRVRSSDVFADLFAHTSRWLQYPAELKRSLEAYPLGRLAGARHILYWEDDRLPWLRPTLTVNHFVAYPSIRDSHAVFVVKKQLYASHYLDGAIELYEVLDLGTGAERNTFLLAIRYARLDQLSRRVLNLRGRVEGRFQEVLRSDLEQYRTALEEVRSP